MMNMRVLPAENVVFDIDSFRSIPEPGPAQPSAADEGFPSVRLGRLWRRIVAVDTADTPLATQTSATAGNFRLTAGHPQHEGNIVFVETPDDVMDRATKFAWLAASPVVLQFDATNDTITRNINGLRNVADNLKNPIELQ